jgi:phosphate transport system protein
MESNEFTHHISNKYNSEIDRVRELLNKMGVLVTRQLEKSIKALVEDNKKLAKKVIKKDLGVNALEVQIDELCTLIIAKRQPTASDLRLIIAVIKSITDLERIGDGARNIAKHSLSLTANDYHGKFYPELEKIGKLAHTNLVHAIKALEFMNEDKALDVAKADELVDQEFEVFNKHLIKYMSENPDSLEQTIVLNWCARSFERIGDHTKNICEYIIYLVKGKDIRHLDLATVEEEYFDD